MTTAYNDAASTSPIEAFPIANQVYDAAHEWSDGELGLGDVMAGVNVGLGALDFAFNPATAVISAGLAALTEWLLNHCSMFKQMIDQLLGSPSQIDQVGQQYSTLAGEFAAEGNAHADAVTATPNWTGPGADAYRNTQRAINSHYQLAVRATDAVAGGIRMVGVLVGMVREFIIGMVQDLLSELIVEGLIALAAAIPSFGSSIATFCAWATGRIGFAAAKISLKLAKLVRKVMAVCRRFGISTRKLNEIYHALTRAASSIRRGIRGTQMAVGRSAAHTAGRAGRSTADGLRHANGNVGPLAGHEPPFQVGPTGVAGAAGADGADHYDNPGHHVQSI